MARASTSPSRDSEIIATRTITHTLKRIDERLGSATTPLERARAANNLEYARQLVHKLESHASAPSPTISLNAPAKRQKLQAEIAGYKQTIRRLNEALHAASTAYPATGLGAWVSGTENDEGYDTASDDGTEEKVAGGSESTDVGQLEEMNEVDDYARLDRPTVNKRESSMRLLQPAATAATANELGVPQATTALPPAPTVRNRFPGRQKQSEQQKRQALFGNAGTRPAGQGTEALLDHQRQEQEDITEDLVKMAQMLKASSLEFGKSLEEEKVYLDEAKQGLDRNAIGVEVAARRIEDLRKNDSVSFYWSIIYLASIVVLAFFILFILFFAPKLRWW